jgi:streptogramin lyase
VPDLFRFNPETGTGDAFDYGLPEQQTKSANTLLVTDNVAWLKSEDPFLIRLDRETGEVEWIVTSDRGSGVVIADRNALWMSLWRDNAVVRIDL